VRKLLVTFALRQEGVSFERRLTRRVNRSGATVGRLDRFEITVTWLGVGLSDSNPLTVTIADLRPEIVINSGFAGAVRTLLEPGDFLLAENFSSPELVAGLPTGRVFDARGSFDCVDKIAEPEDKMSRKGEGRYIAVDMESARLAEVCSRFSVLFLTARMVSDRYDERIPGIFLGRGIRELPDVFHAIRFAARMISLRRRLASRVSELIALI
jgi:nucleoside phosphorylase